MNAISVNSAVAVAAAALAVAALAGCGDPQPPPLVCDPRAAGAPAFADATADWGLGAVVGNRLVSADLDGDGWPDLLVTAISSNRREVIGAPPKLVWALMNRPRPDGSGRTFIDATLESGLWRTRDGSTTELRAAHVHVAADVDNDGDLDVFSGTYVEPTKPDTDPGDRSEILLNDGAGRFTLAPRSAPSPPASELLRRGGLRARRRDHGPLARRRWHHADLPRRGDRRLRRAAAGRGEAAPGGFSIDMN
jgi:hypothetical protein